MKNEIQKSSEYSQRIDEEDIILQVLKIFFKRIKIISIFSIVSVILSIGIALLIPNVYMSSALLAPAEDTESLSSKLGAYSSLAGIANVSLPGETNNSSSEAIERIKSFSFFQDYFLPNIKLEDLYAANGWDEETNQVTYKSKIFDNKKGTWVREVKPPKKSKPSNQEAFEIYEDILSISEDRKTMFVRVSIEHFSPHIAKEWLEIIIFNINESMRKIDQDTAKDSISFLNQTAQDTNLNEIKEAISALLETQMQNLMLASASEYYIFKIIDYPIAAEEKIRPNRAIVVILGSIIGFLVALFTAIGIEYYSKNHE
tara:strand:+ start:110 stop:1054 length:945 start_codon:yes stop_codon:yes gene_type:complete